LVERQHHCILVDHERAHERRILRRHRLGLVVALDALVRLAVGEAQFTLPVLPASGDFTPPVIGSGRAGPPYLANQAMVSPTFSISPVGRVAISWPEPGISTSSVGTCRSCSAW